MDVDRARGLTRRQLSLLVWCAMISPLIRHVPGAAGKGSWLTGLLTLPGALLLGLLLLRCCHHIPPACLVSACGARRSACATGRRGCRRR